MLLIPFAHTHVFSVLWEPRERWCWPAVERHWGPTLGSSGHSPALVPFSQLAQEDHVSFRPLQNSAYVMASAQQCRLQSKEIVVLCFFSYSLLKVNLIHLSAINWLVSEKNTPRIQSWFLEFYGEDLSSVFLSWKERGSRAHKPNEQYS